MDELDAAVARWGATAEQDSAPDASPLEALLGPSETSTAAKRAADASGIGQRMADDIFSGTFQTKEGKRIGLHPGKESLDYAGEDPYGRPDPNVNSVDKFVNKHVALSELKGQYEKANPGHSFDEQSFRKSLRESYQARAMQQADTASPNDLEGLRTASAFVPVLKESVAYLSEADVHQAQSRIDSGKATLRDYRIVADSEKRAQAETQKGVGRKFAESLAGLPAGVGQYTLGGPAGATAISVLEAAGQVASGAPVGEQLQRVGQSALTNAAFGAVGGMPGMHGAESLAAGVAKSYLAAQSAKEAGRMLGTNKEGGLATALVRGDMKGVEDNLIELAVFATAEGATKATKALASKVADMKARGVDLKSKAAEAEVQNALAAEIDRDIAARRPPGTPTSPVVAPEAASPPPGPAAAKDAPGPFRDVSPTDLALLGQSLGLKAKNPADLVDQLRKRGMSDAAITDLADRVAGKPPAAPLEPSKLRLGEPRTENLQTDPNGPPIMGPVHPVLDAHGNNVGGIAVADGGATINVIAGGKIGSQGWKSLIPALEKAYPNARTVEFQSDRPINPNTVDRAPRSNKLQTIRINRDKPAPAAPPIKPVNQPGTSAPPEPKGVPADRPAHVGRPTTIATPDGPVQARYEVRDLGEVRASHKAIALGLLSDQASKGKYPKGLQPRDYSVEGEQAKVLRHAEEMDPRYFNSDHPDATSGPPTITNEGIVLNGNGRQMTLEMAEHAGTFDKYRDDLIAKASQFGIDPSVVEGMDRPALYRVVDMKADSPEAAAFARNGNVATTQSQSPARTAASLGRLIDDTVIDAMKLEGDTTFAEAVTHPTAGKEFRARLKRELPASQVDQYFHPDGRLTDAGTELVRNMLLTKILPVETIEKLGEESKALKKVLEASIPQMLQLKRDYATHDPSLQMVEAIGVFGRNPDLRTPADTDAMLAQKSLFGGQVESLSPGARMMLDFALAHAYPQSKEVKPAQFRQRLGRFVGALEEATAGLFRSENPDIAQIAADELGVPKREGASFGAFKELKDVLQEANRSGLSSQAAATAITATEAEAARNVGRPEPTPSLRERVKARTDAKRSSGTRERTAADDAAVDLERIAADAERRRGEPKPVVEPAAEPAPALPFDDAMAKANLSPIERLVIEQRMADESKTLEAIGNELSGRYGGKMGKSGVKAAEGRALKKLAAVDPSFTDVASVAKAKAASAQNELLARSERQPEGASQTKVSDQPVQRLDSNDRIHAPADAQDAAAQDFIAKQYGNQVPPVAENTAPPKGGFKAFLDAKEAAADAILKKYQSGKVPFSGVPSPELIAAVATKVAVKLAKGVYKIGEYAKFVADAVASFGDDIKPHLKAIWEKGVAEYDKLHSITNESTEAERANRGLPPRVEVDPVGHSFPELRDKVLALEKAEPARFDALVSELAKKPRPVSDLEDAMLLKRQVDLSNGIEAASERANAARDSGNAAEQVLQEAQRAALEDKYTELLGINEAVGTATGRGLNARKMLARSDFSLARMLARAASASGGELRPDDRAVVEQQSKIIRELTDKQVESRQLVERLKANLATAESLAEQRRLELAAKPKADVRAEPSRLDQARADRDAALNNLKRVLDKTTLFANPLDIERLAAIAQTVKAYANLGVAHAGEFLRRLSDDLGRRLTPAEEKGWTNAWNEAHPTKADVARAETAATAADAAVSKAQKTSLEEVARLRRQNRTLGQKVMGGVSDTIDLSRSIMLGMDLPPIFRQGLLTTLAHPVLSFKALYKSAGAFASKDAAARSQAQIEGRRNFQDGTYKRMGLEFNSSEGGMDNMVEEYRSRLIHYVPVFAHLERANAAFINRLRADYADALIKSLTRTGKPTEAEGRQIGNLVNVATGRGNLGKLGEKAVPLLTNIFLAPRYVTSRFQYALGQPLLYGGREGTARTRKLIATEYARTMLGATLTIGAIKLAMGDEVGLEFDPRSSQLGLRIGNTVIDPTAGVKQAATLVSRLVMGSKKTSTGQIQPLRGEGVKYGADAADDVFRFERKKLAPVPAAGLDLASGKDVVGQPATPGSVALGLVTPLTPVEIYQAFADLGVARGSAVALYSLFGGNVQTYQPRKK